MKIEEPILSIKNIFTIEASSVEEAKEIFRSQIGTDKEVWLAFWKELHRICTEGGFPPKWKPEDCGLPVEFIGKN